MKPGEGTSERPLTADDIPQAQQLVVEAGWNQLPADWELMLRLGRGFGIEDATGALIATALTLPLGQQISWISMVLVAGHARRSGLGSRLLRRCMEEVQASGLIAGLDASELGRPLYLGLGFRELYRIQRLVFESRSLVAPPPTGLTLAPLTAGRAMSEVIEWDREINGLERGEILRDLQRRKPHCAFVARRAGRLAGYVLAREGRRTTQIGPVLARDTETAMHLVSSAAHAAGSFLSIDVPVAQTHFTDWLLRSPAKVQREFVRMMVETGTPFDRPVQVYAIAGPELG